MINPQSKVSSFSRETREGELLSIPTQQTQSSERILTPPPSPEKLQHDIFWRETVLYWNRSDYRWSLIEYIPCLMGIIWEEEKMGRLENLSSFPFESQYYFVNGAEAQRLSLVSTNYYRLFRTKIGTREPFARRMSEPCISVTDPQGISQESFLFSRFLKHVLKTTKISCTVLILSLKLAQMFLRRVKKLDNPSCAELNLNQFRLFVTSLLLADKYSEDHPYTNKSWSALSGLPVDDINLLERTFLATMQHELFVCEADFREWTKALQRLCQWNTPNPHHPDNARRVNYTYSSSTGRRFSFSNVAETGTRFGSGNSATSNSSLSSHESKEKGSFWSRFRFIRK